MWTIYITNDACSDYTWWNDEAQTRRNFADIVRSHLDEMKRTDGESPENRDRYNMSVTQEALCFVERYPEREEELIRRIKEGRVFVSPYLCNSLWAFQSVEGAIRTFYPARRLERDWGISIDVAEHMEEPSLPWGVASILAGCGVRWLSVPFYKYDSTFEALQNPPVFRLEGPDGSQVRVVMDPWACVKWSYHQGARGVLADLDLIEDEWLPHYRELGDAYPLRAILASGTHGDLYAESVEQTPELAEKIKVGNNRPGQHSKLVNAILPDLCAAVDEAQDSTPFMQTMRGCFGHSWDLWPVCLAKYAAQMREGERTLLAAEALLAVIGNERSTIIEATRADRERAEWYWAMLSDHSWNGRGEKNKAQNAALRRDWSDDLVRLSVSLLDRAWAALELTGDEHDLTLFNSLSVPRAGLVRVEAPNGVESVAGQAAQIVLEDGKRVLCFVAGDVPGFGFTHVKLARAGKGNSDSGALRAVPTELESPHYRLQVDPDTGGIGSLVHKATGAELVVGNEGRALCQTVYFNREERTLTHVQSQVAALGPVLARVQISGEAAGIRVDNFVTVYSELDRVDFDLRVHKPATTEEQRLCQVFPVLGHGADLRIETTAAVLRPYPQPEGDLLRGADTRRFAVQGFVDASLPGGPGVTIAPIDAFALRMDLEPITFEALGNDQNYRESISDQHGVTEFRFRYSLRGHAGGYDAADAFAWSRGVAFPLLTAKGVPPQTGSGITLDPARAIATCLKPADGAAADGVILRVWETAGHSGPLAIGVRGFRRALRTDLLERDLAELKIVDGEVTIDLRAHGFAALRLIEE